MTFSIRFLTGEDFDHDFVRGVLRRCPGNRGALLHARLRYFDAVNRRAGLPADVAALVQRLTAGETVVTLVNVSPTESRTLIVQGGAYGEHQIQSVSDGGQHFVIDARHVTVHLAPGAGAELTIKMRRYANRPRLAWPWHVDN